MASAPRAAEPEDRACQQARKRQRADNGDQQLLDRAGRLDGRCVCRGEPERGCRRRELRSDLWFAGELSAVAWGGADEAILAGSNQREATTELSAPVTPGFARPSFSGSTRIGGAGNSARALAIDRCVRALSGRATELAAGGDISGAARAGLSFASPTYQQARLVTRSTR